MTVVTVVVYLFLVHVPDLFFVIFTPQWTLQFRF